MKVTEGSTAVLSPLFMEYYDADTEIENLKIVIDSPPTFGYITNALRS
jgi:hypothetical protein